jgi:hypothetical protein
MGAQDEVTVAAPSVVAKEPAAGSSWTVTHPRVPENASPWECSPIELTCKTRRVKGWDLLAGEVTPDVPLSPAISDSRVEQITLVPYGCTQIRIAHFPVAAGNGHRSPPRPSS